MGGVYATLVADVYKGLTCSNNGIVLLSYNKMLQSFLICSCGSVCLVCLFSKYFTLQIQFK